MPMHLIVQVTWDDHAGYTTDEDAKKYGIVRRYTVGYLVREDDESVTLAGTRDVLGVDTMTVIAKALVVRRKVLG